MTKYNINQNHFFKIKEGILQWVAYNAVVRNDLGQYQHEYVLRDHLGNTRVTFTDGVNKGEPYWDWSNYSYIQPDNTGYDDGVVTEADIKHINHTYPFGMAMEGNWNNAGSANNNRYLYNGKQYNDDFGMGWYDYGARFYDPAIGRWNTIDPLAGKYPSWSPYSYVMDNPVSFFDKDGREPVLPIYTITYTVQVYKVETREVCETAVTDPLLGSTERVNCQTVTEKTLVAEVDFNFTVEQQKCGGVKMLSESGAQGAATQISGEKSEDVSKVTGSSDVALTSDKTMGTITLNPSSAP
jgi:RHS repeat-associated protein